MPHQPRFILDVHLGKLAHHLRMLGYDTLYRNDYTAGELVRIAREENRILLSKDRKLLKENSTLASSVVRSSNPREQLIEILKTFDLLELESPFSRCLLCNTRLHAVEWEAVVDRLPPKVRQLFNEFQFCPTCGRTYWLGSHYERMQRFIDEILRELGTT